jgi:methionine biosynthesis protein MetW
MTPHKHHVRRYDLSLIADLIPTGSRVLDVGCGDGELFSLLAGQKKIHGHGIEIDPNLIARCVKRGVPVVQSNAEFDLSDYPDQSFDYVILSRTVQVLKNADRTMLDVARIGRTAVISVINFGYWRVRLSLLVKGRMPVTSNLPFDWYNTPNIHLCTLKDFEDFCNLHGMRVKNRIPLRADSKGGWLSRLFPNLFADLGIFEIERKI